MNIEEQHDEKEGAWTVDDQIDGDESYESQD